MSVSFFVVPVKIITFWLASLNLSFRGIRVQNSGKSACQLDLNLHANSDIVAIFLKDISSTQIVVVSLSAHLSMYLYISRTVWKAVIFLDCWVVTLGIDYRVTSGLERETSSRTRRDHPDHRCLVYGRKISNWSIAARFSSCYGDVVARVFLSLIATALERTPAASANSARTIQIVIRILD